MVAQFSRKAQLSSLLFCDAAPDLILNTCTDGGGQRRPPEKCHPRQTPCLSCGRYAPGPGYAVNYCFVCVFTSAWNHFYSPHSNLPPLSTDHHILHSSCHPKPPNTPRFSFKVGSWKLFFLNDVSIIVFSVEDWQLAYVNGLVQRAKTV